jgi:hypothetical protein
MCHSGDRLTVEAVSPGSVDLDGAGDHRQRRRRRDLVCSRAGNVEHDLISAGGTVGESDGFAQRTGARIVGV